MNTPEKLYGWYAEKQGRAEPMHVALPTDGLYAQTIMDECVALEEHYGDLDWVLNDKEPELGELDPSLLMSRRAEPVATTPTAFPQTIISLQNAPEAPAPSGLAGALQAVQNAGPSATWPVSPGPRPMPPRGFQTAANLATSFGQQAAALKLAEMAAKRQATKEANQKLGTIKKAKEEQLVTPEKAAEQAGKGHRGPQRSVDDAGQRRLCIGDRRNAQDSEPDAGQRGHCGPGRRKGRPRRRRHS